MGRQSYFPDYTFAAKARLAKVPINTSGYDSGGAYWGYTPTQPLWLVRAANDANDQLYWFLRAANREEAKAKIKQSYPQVSFYR